MKLNPLPPTLREKQRYLVFGIISKKDFELNELVSTVWDKAQQLFGEVGTAEFSLWVPANLYDKTKKIAIARCNHTSVEKMRAVLASIRDINNEPVLIHILGVTGTIRSARRKFFGITDLTDFQR